MMPLGLLGAGEVGEILEIRAPKTPVTGAGAGEQGRCECRVEDLGIRVGRTVEVLNNGGGPLLLKVGESRLAIDRSLAMKIMIKEVGR
jgi:ferrous iron transport protein A